MANETVYAYCEVTGHQRILGTDHPVYALVYRSGRYKWTASVVCNGIASMSADFRTKREAIAWHEGRKTRRRQERLARTEETRGDN